MNAATKTNILPMTTLQLSRHILCYTVWLVWVTKLVLLRFQNVSCLSVSVGFAE